MPDATRDVVVNIRLKMVGDSPIARISRDADKAAQAVEQSFKSTARRAAKDTADALSKSATQWGDAFRRQIGDVESRLKGLRRDLGNVAAAGPIVQAGAPPAAGQAGPAANAVAGAIGAAGKAGPKVNIKEAIFQVGAGIFTIARAPQTVAGFLEGVAGGARAEVAGGEQADKSGTFTSAGISILNSIESLRRSFGVTFGQTGLEEGYQFLRGGTRNANQARNIDLQTANRDLQLQASLVGVQEMIRKTERLQDAQRTTLGIELDAVRQRKQAAVESLGLARQELDAVNQRISSAREEYGLSTKLEQQQLQTIAKKISTGGVQSLSGEELQFARGQQAFRQLISGAAQRNDAGFNVIEETLGLQREQRAAQQKVLAAEIKNEINVQQELKIELALNQLDTVVDKLRKAEAELTGRLAERVAAQTIAAIRASQEANRMQQVPQ